MFKDVSKLFEEVLEDDMARLEKDRSLLGSALLHDNRWLFTRCRVLENKGKENDKDNPKPAGEEKGHEKCLVNTLHDRLPANV